MIKQVACLLATALLLVPATTQADGKGQGGAPAGTGSGGTGVYYPPQSPSIPDLDLAPNEMLNRNVRILRTTNKAQLNRYVPVAYAFNNVNPYAVRRFINRAVESEDGVLFTFVSPDGNSGRLLAMIPEYQIPSLDRLVASIDRANLTSSSGSHRAYVQLKHRRADLSDLDFLDNFAIYLTADGDRVIIDPEQNAVFIEDAPSGTEYLLAALEEKLDRPTPQVLASVNIYEVDGTNNARLGNDYIAWKNGPGANLFAFGAFAERGRTSLRSGGSDVLAEHSRHRRRDQLQRATTFRARATTLRSTSSTARRSSTSWSRRARRGC
jgi:general secretion pathway protein D